MLKNKTKKEAEAVTPQKKYYGHENDFADALETTIETVKKTRKKHKQRRLKNIGQDKEVGKRIKRLRLKMGLSQAALSKKLKLAVSNLSQYELGLRQANPHKIKLMIRMARRLGYQDESLDKLYGV